MPPLGPRMRNAIKGFLESDHLGKGVYAKFGQASFESVITKRGRGILGLPNHHVNYQSGLTDEEVSRFSVASPNRLQVWRLEAQLKGGGADNNIVVDVYDLTSGQELASVTAGDKAMGGDSPLGSPRPVQLSS